MQELEIDIEKDVTLNFKENVRKDGSDKIITGFKIKPFVFFPSIVGKAKVGQVKVGLV